jgi:predicted Zn-dependent peptidase
MDFAKFTEELKKYKIKVGIFKKGVYTNLAQIIPDGETIKYAVEGIDEKSQTTPLIVTDKAVYMMSQGLLMASGASTIPLSKITSVSSVKGAMGGLFQNIVIAEGTIIHTVGVVVVEVSTIISTINGLMAQTQPQQAPAAAPVSQADELAKFKKLLDDGVLTQEEFDVKKKQLLNL